jgi:nitrogen fixation protein NifU and related proteins
MSQNQNSDDFFNSHSLNFLEMALSTDKIEKVVNPDGYGKKTGECGDSTECFLIYKRDCIESVSHWINGCRYTIACCNTISRLAEGKTIEEAWDISPEDVNNFLETLPGDHFHCAELAVGALYLALADLARKIRHAPYKLKNRCK